MPSPPWSDTSNAAPLISRVSHQHLYRLSHPIIRWYHTVTPYDDTSPVPNYSRLQWFRLPSLRMVEYHSTPPISKSFGLLSSGSNYRFLPHAVPSPGCLSITPLATPGLPQTLRATSMLFRVYVLYVPDLHLPSRLITRSEMSLATATTAAPPIRIECNAISLGLRRDYATTSLTARRARPYPATLTGISNRPYLTTLTELPNRYETA